MNDDERKPAGKGRRRNGTGGKRAKPPSSGASRHLLPEGRRGGSASRPAIPSPRRGEGGPHGEPGEGASAAATERIARRLARAGVASRREAEAMIAAGRVTLNGRVLSSPAVNVGAEDRIAVDGVPLPPTERTRLFLFHKPVGVVTTNHDPEGRRTVFDVLPEDLPRLVTVGRLDRNTEGLLLLTNDGGLARVLELPATGWLRRYRVRVHGKVDRQALEALKEGIAVDGVFYGAIEAALDRVQGTNAWLTIGLREGKNREVRNVLGALGLDVARLIRVSYGPFQLGDLAPGTVREIRGRTLRDQLGERLIRQAGADFDAPIARPFAGKADKVKADKGKPRGDKPKPGAREPASKRKPDRTERRDAALERLQTKPGRAAGAARRERRDEPLRLRVANVWMAPGARPMGRKKVEEQGSGGEAQETSRRGKRTGKKSGARSSGASRGKGRRGS